MRTETINIYKFDELSENAQRRAWENGPDLSGGGGDEFHATLEQFEKYFDIKIYRYSVDNWRYDFDFITAGAATDAPDGDALRLARYIWNNYAEYITRGKYYSTRGEWINGKYNYKYRHSKIIMQRDNCPLTGTYCDYYILNPVNNCLDYKEFFETYDDLITACLNEFFRAWRDDIEYRTSKEYFAEIAECNEWEFTADGAFYRAV